MKIFKTVRSTVSMLLLILMLLSMPVSAQAFDNDSLNCYARPQRPHRWPATFTTQFDENFINCDSLSTDILEKGIF